MVLSFFNWNYQISNSCFLEDIDPIFNFHLIDITDISTHVVWKILIPYSRFRKMFTRIFMMSAPPFVSIFGENDVRYFAISKNNTSGKDSGAFLNDLRYLGVSEIQNNWFWGHVHVRWVRQPWRWGVFGFSQNEIEKLLIPNKAE